MASVPELVQPLAPKQGGVAMNGCACVSVKADPRLSIRRQRDPFTDDRDDQECLCPCHDAAVHKSTS